MRISQEERRFGADAAVAVAFSGFGFVVGVGGLEIEVGGVGYECAVAASGVGSGRHSGGFCDFISLERVLMVVDVAAYYTDRCRRLRVRMDGLFWGLDLGMDTRKKSWATCRIYSHFPPMK